MFFRLSAPKLVTPDVYSFTELVVGMECRRRPMFIIITIAAKVTGRPFRSRKWEVIEGRTCREGRQNRWPNIDQRNIPCHARHTQFKVGGSRGSRSVFPWLASEEDLTCCPAYDPNPDSYPCIPESSSHLLLRPVQDFLVLLSTHCHNASARGTQLWETQYWFCIFCLISSISGIITKAVLISNL